MGLASSQCRLLMLTARKDDLEANLMSVANTKLALTRQTQAAAEKYSRALDTTKYQMANTTGTSNVDLTYGLLMDYTQASNIPGQYLMEDSSGRVVLSDSDAQLVQSISGSTGAGFSVTADMEKAYLEKKMGITDAQAATYVSGYTTGAAQVSNTPSISNIQSSISAVTDITSTVTNLKDASSSTVGFPSDGNYNISETCYQTFKTNFTTLTQQLKSLKESTNYQSYSSDQKKYVDQMIANMATATAQLEIAHNSSGSNSQRLGAIATIKELFDGSSTNSMITGQHWYGGWFSGHTNDAAYATDNVTDALKATCPSYQDRGSAYKYNMTDLISLLGSDTTSTDTITSTAASQTQANFYINQLNAMGANGFVDVSYATTQSSLQNALKNQAIYLVKYQGNNAWGQTTTSDSSSALREVDDTDAQTKAEAEYKAETARLNTKEAQLDLQEKNYDTERSEVDTEIDSVKTILNKNIERSFKMFQA